MKHSQKSKLILLICMGLIGVFTVFLLFRRSFKSDKNLGYEQITMEQAVKYMKYEKDYVLIDVSSEEEYKDYHIPSSISVPYDELKQYASDHLEDKTQMIYVCSSDGTQSRKAANLLCEAGYTNVTEIGRTDKYEAASEAAIGLLDKVPENEKGRIRDK